MKHMHFVASRNAEGRSKWPLRSLGATAEFGNCLCPLGAHSFADRQLGAALPLLGAVLSAVSLMLSSWPASVHPNVPRQAPASLPGSCIFLISFISRLSASSADGIFILFSESPYGLKERVSL